MNDVEPGAEVSRQPDGERPIRPLDTAIAIASIVLLGANVAADWQSNDYSGGMVSVALIALIGAILGKNIGSIVGGGK